MNKHSVFTFAFKLDYINEFRQADFLDHERITTLYIYDSKK